MPGVPLDKFGLVWPIAAKYFEEAAEEIEDSFSLEFYRDSCLSGKYLLWVSRDSKAAAILEVSEYPKGQECDIVMLAGTGITEWIEELDEIEAWAKRTGCNRMVLTGREEWVRVLKNYDVKTVTMVKEL